MTKVATSKDSAKFSNQNIPPIYLELSKNLFVPFLANQYKASLPVSGNFSTS